MKKVFFCFIFFMLCFLNFNVYAKEIGTEYEKYTGQALSDDYEMSDDEISTYGAITVDPGMGGSSDDEFEMNDSFETATNVTNLMCFSGNFGNFEKHLSIVNHSNGNSDSDYLYFENNYYCKTFNISISTDSFVKYNLSLYSVQGRQYVLVKSTDMAINYTNFECGAYVLRLVFTNNTQANYKLSFNCEKTTFKANQSELSATSIYDGITKNFRWNYFKFYPNKTGQFKIEFDYEHIENFEIYEYVTYNNFSSGTKKLNYDINNRKSEVNLFQANKSANRVLNPNSNTGYYICFTAKKFGDSYFKIEYNDVRYCDYTRLLEKHERDYLFPIDDLSIFTTIYDKNNIECNSSEIVRFDVLTKDFSSGNEKYDKVFGGTNVQSIKKSSPNDNNSNNPLIGSIKNHTTIMRFASLDYTYDEETNYEDSVIVNYARIALIEDVNGQSVDLYTALLMNYKYLYDYYSNTLYLLTIESTISLNDFEYFTYSNKNVGIEQAKIDVVNNSNTEAEYYAALSNVRKDIADEAIGTIMGLKSITKLLYCYYETFDKILYCTTDYEKNAYYGEYYKDDDIYKVMEDKTSGNSYIGSYSRLTNFSYSYNNIMNISNPVSPYYPNVFYSNSNDSLYLIHYKFKSNINIFFGDLKYELSFNIKFKSLNGENYKFNNKFERGYFNDK